MRSTMCKTASLAEPQAVCLCILLTWRRRSWCATATVLCIPPTPACPPAQSPACYWPRRLIVRRLAHAQLRLGCANGGERVHTGRAPPAQPQQLVYRVQLQLQRNAMSRRCRQPRAAALQARAAQPLRLAGPECKSDVSSVRTQSQANKMSIGAILGCARETKLPWVEGWSGAKLPRHQSPQRMAPAISRYPPSLPHCRTNASTPSSQCMYSLHKRLQWGGHGEWGGRAPLRCTATHQALPSAPPLLLACPRQ